jgi:hypothetical protein
MRPMPPIEPTAQFDSPLQHTAETPSGLESGPTEHPAAWGGSVTTLEQPKVSTRTAVQHVLAPTNDLIDQMWTAGREAEAIDGWTVGEFDTESSVFARRVFISTVATIVIALVAASTWFVTGRGDASLESTLTGINQASEVLIGSLDEADLVIVDLTDGDLSNREGAAAASTAVDGAARTLFSHGAELPADDEWSQLRAETVSLSDRSIATARLLSRTTAYVATVEVMLNRPDYPLSVNDEELGDVAEMTATWVSRFIATSSSLPSVNALDDHRGAIVDLADRLPSWQSRYLDALRAGDVAGAGEVVGELEASIGLLETDLATAVSAVAVELTGQRTALMADLRG